MFMTKKLKVLAVAALFTVAAVGTTRAAAAVTSATVLQNVTVALTAYSQVEFPPYTSTNGDIILETNKADTIITGKVAASSITTRSLIKAIGEAIGTTFSPAAKLVAYTTYADTNVYNYSVTSSSVSLFGTNLYTNTLSTNFVVTDGNSNYFFYVYEPYDTGVTPTETNTSSSLFYEFYTNFAGVSTNFTNVVLPGTVTNVTAFTLVTNATVFTNVGPNGLEIIDGKTTTVLTTGGTNVYHTAFSSVPSEFTLVTTNVGEFSIITATLPSSGYFNGTEKAKPTNDMGLAIYATETGTIYSTGGSLLLNSPSVWVLNLSGGFATGSRVSLNFGTAKAPIYVDTFDSTANVSGSGYLGGTEETTNTVSDDTTNTYQFVSNAIPAIVKGTLTTTYWTTIKN
jgi:hypothetical protein